MNLHGFEIHCSVLMVESFREERRVRGGYMNRWLIREIVSGERPLKAAYRFGNSIYLHPDMLDELNRELERQNKPVIFENKNSATDFVRARIKRSMQNNS